MNGKDRVIAWMQKHPWGTWDGNRRVPKCDCGADLDENSLEMYPHDAGWDIGLSEPQWLYLVCPKCHYQHALWKLGIKREETFNE